MCRREQPCGFRVACAVCVPRTLYSTIARPRGPLVSNLNLELTIDGQSLNTADDYRTVSPQTPGGGTANCLPSTKGMSCCSIGGSVSRGSVASPKQAKTTKMIANGPAFSSDSSAGARHSSSSSPAERRGCPKRLGAALGHWWCSGEGRTTRASPNERRLVSGRWHRTDPSAVPGVSAYARPRMASIDECACSMARPAGTRGKAKRTKKMAAQSLICRFCHDTTTHEPTGSSASQRAL